MATPDTTNVDEKMRMLVHEIRNPLSSIYLTIDILRTAKANGEDPDFYIDLLEKSAKKIDEILQGIHTGIPKVEKEKE